MEKKAGVQRCGTWESSRDNFHLIPHHQKLLHKIIVNYGGLLCIWFPTAATTAVTFLKIKCMFHLLTEREEGGKKVKKDKFVMENPLKSPVLCSLSLALAVPQDKQQGQGAVSPGRVAIRARAVSSHAMCSCHVHPPQITAVSYLHQGTLDQPQGKPGAIKSRLHWASFCVQTSSRKVILSLGLEFLALYFQKGGWYGSLE